MSQHQIDQLVDLVAELGPIAPAELLRGGPLAALQPVQLMDLVAAAVEAGRITDDGEQLHLVVVDEVPHQQRGGPIRAVAIDFEAVVRPVAARPFRERRPYQVGAVRFGRDAAWVEERPELSAWCALPDAGSEWTIDASGLAALHRREAVPAAQWLAELDEILWGADVVVAYNGGELDFPLLDQERASLDLPALSGVELVDGLVVAQMLWPSAPSHTLGSIARLAGVDLSEGRLHDARVDAEVLAKVMAAGSVVIRDELDADLVAVLRSACRDSSAWRLLSDLAEIDDELYEHSVEDVAKILGHDLDARSVRPRRGNVTRQRSLAVPAEVLDDVGHVDPHLLAEQIRGRNLERRAAQGQMAEVIRGWLADDHGGLIEAPTGTGKSLVLLAAALDWVRGGSTRRAIIATHTKQLQSQLAGDIEQLAKAGIGGLDEVGDLVKGASNRLSVRALITALADATSEDGRSPTGPRADPARAELLGYLALRLLDATSMTELWLSHSVDSSDIPLVFARTAEGSLHRWLHQLSQGDQGDYATDSDLAAARHTDKVVEALSAARIVVANHALLLAHRDDLEEMADGLCVFVDEAHELESAVTDALTSSFDYAELERLVPAARRLAREAGNHDAMRLLSERLRELERFLTGGTLASMAAELLDRLSEDTSEVGQRAVTLASDFSGGRSFDTIAGMHAAVDRTQRHLWQIWKALAYFAHDEEGYAAADRWTQERCSAVSSSVYGQLSAITAVNEDLTRLLGTPKKVRHLGQDGASDAGADDGDATARESPTAAILEIIEKSSDLVAPDAPVEVADVVAEDDDDEDLTVDDVAADADGDAASALDSGGPDDFDDPGSVGDLVVDDQGSTNAVVWMSEDVSPGVATSTRNLRFSLGVSPVELRRSAPWRELLSLIPRLVMTSGTLTVAGSFDFIVGRLGLPESARTEVLESPFDLARQARLLCLSDFPSWVEHPVRSVRSVAQQVTNYTDLMSSAPEGEEHNADEGRAVESTHGVAGGAMVLTTSRATAAAISEALGPFCARRGLPIATTELLGNARAVETFAETGGILVGTRGLWQGVDISNPDRLHLVWINKLPFAPFADPVIAARRAAVAEEAVRRGADDPDQTADEGYYLPMAALGLRQAVGRLIRSTARLLLAAEAGRAVFVTSRIVLHPTAYWGTYGATKAALHHLIQCWAGETATSTLRINLADPGPVATALRRGGFPGEDQSKLPHPTDIAPGIADMCGPAETRHGELVRVSPIPL